MPYKLFDRATCARCEQDIENHGGGRWVDRGNNRACAPFIDHKTGETVRPRGKHSPRVTSAKQFPDVFTRYGAPMGRRSSPLGDAPWTVRLFRVRLDSGGYDDGGAYWGHGGALYCAQCPEGGQVFTRANSRAHAARILEIDPLSLKVKV